MTPQNCITIPLTRGYSTVIDSIDLDLADFHWQTCQSDNHYYGQRRPIVAGKKTTEYIHRVILSRMLGRELLHREKVDHVDGDGLNNRRENLRLATHTQNMRNRNKNKNNIIGYKGVYKNGKRFQARIGINGKKKSLGTYDSAELAALAYDTAAINLYGEFALTNASIAQQTHHISDLTG